MNIDQILNEIKKLSESQGFYERLYEDLMDIKNNDGPKWKSVVEELEGQKFEGILDMILYFEE